MTGISGKELRRVAVQAVEREQAQRRGFTYDLVRLGRPEDARLVGTESLAAALVGAAQLREGRWGEALAALAGLPHGRYRYLVPDVTAAGAGAGPSHVSYPVALQWLNSLPSHPVAESAIRFFNTGHVDDDLLDALAACDLIPGVSVGLIQQVAGGDRVDQRNADWITPIRMAPESVDDLIDSGVFDATDLPQILAAHPNEADYFTARLQPESLSDEAVRRLGFAAEASRRRAAAPNGRIDHAVSRFLGGDETAEEELAEALSDSEVAALRSARTTVLDNPGALPSEAALFWPFVAFAAQRILGASLLELPEGGEVRGPRTSALLGITALNTAIDAAYLGHWEAAIRHARSVLQHSREEPVRDEALNVMACALWQQGHDRQALDALAAATAGQYTVNLVANAAVVARDLDPVKAANYLATLVEEAPNPQLKVQAAKTAIALWLSDEDDSFAELTSDTDALPGVIARPLRALLISDLDRDEFQSLLAIARRHDSDWLATPGVLAKSPHAHSLAAAYHCAFADDPSKALDVMARALKAGQAEPWLLEERDLFMGMLIEAMLSSESVPVAGVIAINAIDSKMPMDEDHRIPLAALAARELALAFAADDDSPGRLNSERLDLMVWAVAGVERMTDARRPFGRELARDCATAVQFSTLRSVAHDMSEIHGLLMGIPRNRMRAAMADLRSLLLDARTDVLKLYPHVDPKAQGATTDIVGGIDQLLSLG